MFDDAARVHHRDPVGHVGDDTQVLGAIGRLLGSDEETAPEEPLFAATQGITQSRLIKTQR